MAEEDLKEELGIADCLIITRAFERGATFSNTPEATYALLTPQLSIARIQSTSISNQLLNDNSTLTMLGADDVTTTEKDSNSMIEQLRETNFSKKDRSILSTKLVDEDLGKGLLPGVTKKGLFNNECIPCGSRLNLAGELSMKMVTDDIKKYYKMWKDALQAQLSQLIDMIKMLGSWESQAIDLCALLKFFTEFVCIPDLARILSVLMAFMMRINFDLNIVFDLVLQFAAPLIQPFLSNFVNLLMKYAYMIIAPIECIVNAIQSMLSKLDYNILFQNIEQLNRSFSLGENIGPETERAGAQTTKLVTLGGMIPWINIDKGIHTGPRQLEGEFSLLGPAGTAIKQENQENKKAAELAFGELKAIQSVRIDSRDASAIAAHQEKLEAARQKYSDAIDKKDLSSVGRASKQIGETFNSFKSTLYWLIDTLKKEVESFEAFLKSVFDELQKLMNTYLGGGGNFLQLITSKLAIAQMVGFITAIIKAIKDWDLHCDKEKIQPEQVLPKTANRKIWTDEEGNLHIEDEDSISGYVETVVAALGVNPLQNSLGKPQAISNTDNKTVVSTNSDAPRQRLKSLIKFTGEPELDSSVLRAIDTLTTPVNIVFKCPLKTSVQDVEQINQWIKELNMA